MKTLQKALAVLKQLARAPGPMGITELSAATGIDKAIVHRALKTLVAEKLAAQDPATRKYLLGPGWLQMAGFHLAQLQPVEVAKPHLMRLWSDTDETINLSVQHDLEVMRVLAFESRRNVRVSARVGEVAPLHCTAAGKVFLAFGPAALLDEAIAAGLEQRQPKAITDPARLREDIALTRRRRYGTDVEESDLDYSAIGAPVIDHDGRCVAAVAIAMPVRRYQAADIDSLVGHLLDCADAISHELGGRLPPPQ
jgi:DNA-binding IclR family transcriptional regulator